MTPLEHLHVAMKRARHFAGRAGIDWTWPFSITGVTGLSIIVRNMLSCLDHLADLPPRVTREDRWRPLRSLPEAPWIAEDETAEHRTYVYDSWAGDSCVLMSRAYEVAWQRLTDGESPAVRKMLGPSWHAYLLDVLSATAQSINNYIDTHPIEGDTEAEWALACFLSRVPLGDLSGVVAWVRANTPQGASS